MEAPQAINSLAVAFGLKPDTTPSQLVEALSYYKAEHEALERKYNMLREVHRETEYPRNAGYKPVSTSKPIRGL